MGYIYEIKEPKKIRIEKEGSKIPSSTEFPDNGRITESFGFAEKHKSILEKVKYIILHNVDQISESQWLCTKETYQNIKSHIKHRGIRYETISKIECIGLKDVYNLTANNITFVSTTAIEFVTTGSLNIAGSLDVTGSSINNFIARFIYSILFC